MKFLAHSFILCTGFSKNIGEYKAKAIGAADYIENHLISVILNLKLGEFWTENDS